MLDGITIDLDKAELTGAEKILHGLAYLIGLAREVNGKVLTEARHDIFCVSVDFEMNEEDSNVLHKIGWMLWASKNAHGSDMTVWEIFT